MNKSKVVFVHHDGLLTGSAKSLMNMIAGLSDDILVHVVLAEDGELRTKLEEMNVEVSILPFYRFWTAPGPKIHYPGSINNFKALLKNESLKQHLLKLKPNLIHINDKAAMQAGISMRGCGIPIIQHLRSSFYSTHFKPFKWLFVYQAKRYADALIAISEDEADGFNQNPKLNIIYNSLDFEKSNKAIATKLATRSALGYKKDDILIGYIAHVSKIKGVFDFLKAGKKLIANNNHIKLLIVGQTPDEIKPKWYHRLFYSRETYAPKQELNSFKETLKNNLSVLGYRNDALEIMAALDVLVVCNHLGVLGRQPFEAMSVKTNVVVTSGHSGKSKIILHRKTGIVVQPKSHPEIAEAINYILNNQKEAEIITEEAYHYAGKLFDRNINAKNVLTIYKNLLN